MPAPTTARSLSGRSARRARWYHVNQSASGTKRVYTDYNTRAFDISINMSYGRTSAESVLEHAKSKNAFIVDMRSDTISRPSASMRQAMMNAEVGDDVFGEDPTVKKLEEKAAKLLHKEAALFVSTGTMGNLIALMNHCDKRGCETYCGRDSHIVLHEQGGAAQIAGVTVLPLPNFPDGTFDIEELEMELKSDLQHEPISTLVAIENTLNGKVVPQKWINELGDFCKSHNLKLHMDGARLWNASVASGRPVHEIVAPVDSVTFCLSKGLGAPAGSVLCGTKEFVKRARRIRKALGGGMRQVGVLAAAGIVALDEIVPLLKEDHRRARKIAEAIHNCNSKIFNVNLNTTNTNMILINIKSKSINAIDFINRCQFVSDDETDSVIVRGLALSPKLARFVTYYELRDDMIEKAINKILYVIKEIDATHANV